MKYYKIENEKYILGVYKGSRGSLSVTREEYDRICAALSNAPEVESGKGCGLRKENLEWEIFDIPYEGSRSVDHSDENITEGNE